MYLADIGQLVFVVLELCMRTMAAFIWTVMENILYITHRQYAIHECCPPSLRPKKCFLLFCVEYSGQKQNAPLWIPLKFPSPKLRAASPHNPIGRTANNENDMGICHFLAQAHTAGNRAIDSHSRTAQNYATETPSVLALLARLLVISGRRCFDSSPSVRVLAPPPIPLLVRHENSTMQRQLYAIK